MKLISIIISFAILLSGCYSHATVTKESVVENGVEVTFRLQNGTYILSKEYQRVENGYKIVGKLTTNEYKDSDSKSFSGIVNDDQIEQVVINELDSGMTAVVLILTVGVVVGLVLVGQLPGSGFNLR